MGTIDDCKVVDLGRVHNVAGNITVINEDSTIPFKIKRVYYLYDIPAGSERGGHAHRQLYQLIVAASGSFDISLDDGINKKKIYLNHPNKGLLVVPGIWRQLDNFSSGSICLVLVSDKYNENDYIRDYDSYKEFRK